MLKALSQPNTEALIHNLKAKLPSTCNVYNCLIMNSANIDKGFFTWTYLIPEGQTETTADVIIVWVQHTSFCYPYILFPDDVKVGDYMESLVKFVDTPMVLGGIPNPLFGDLCHVAEKTGFVVFPDPCRVVTLQNAEDLPKFKSEEGIDVVSLSVDYAQIIVDHWMFKRKNTLTWMKNLVECGLSYGTFVDGKLVSWICFKYSGEMGSLHTLEGFRGRGYAKRCVVALTQKLLEMGIIPTVYVQDGNEASLKLFYSLGFKLQSKRDYNRLDREESDEN